MSAVDLIFWGGVWGVFVGPNLGPFRYLEPFRPLLLAQLRSLKLSCSVALICFPFFLVAAPLKWSSQKKGSLFFQGHWATEDISPQKCGGYQRFLFGSCQLPGYQKLAACGCGSRCTSYASFGPCFHLPGFHVGTGFLSHSHVFICRGSPSKWTASKAEAVGLFQRPTPFQQPTAGAAASTGGLGVGGGDLELI